MGRVLVLVATGCLGVGCGGFELVVQIEPVDESVTVLIDHEARAANHGRVRFTRDFGSYPDALMDSGIDVEIIVGGQSAFQKMLRPGFCAGEGDSWDTETLFVDLSGGTPMLSGYECRDGDTKVVGIAN